MSYIRRKRHKNGQIYLTEVESKRVNGKIIQKHIRYIGKEVDGEVVISLSSKDIQVDSVRVYGPLLALHGIAQKIGLPKVLGEYSNEILSMVYAHCLDYKSVRHMPEWYKRTDLNALLNLKELTQSRLVSAMDSLNDEKIEDYQDDLFKSVKKTYSIDSKGIVYDLTNTYFYGKKCPMGKVGRSKDGHRQDDLVQIALATTQKEGIPVFHKTFDGNIHDSKTLPDISYSLDKFKIPSGLFVYDKGIVSEKNLNLIGKMGWFTLCGLPVREKEKAVIRKFLKRKKLNQISNMVTVGGGNFYVKSLAHSLGRVQGKLAICYNEARKVDMCECQHMEILQAQQLRKENKKIDKSLEKFLTPQGRLRNDVIEKEQEFYGYTCIFSTKNVADKDMVRLYFDKDIIERAFKTLKGVSNLRPVRCWLKRRVKAHIFICYLSYLLLSLLKMNLKSKNIMMSPEKAMEELETMYNVYFSDKKNKFQFARTVTLSKSQEKILKCIDSKILKKAKNTRLKL